MTSRPLIPALLVLNGLIFSERLTSSALAWPATAYRAMAYDALRVVPPSLARVLARNEAALLEGAGRLEPEMAARLARDGLRGELAPETLKAVEMRVTSIAEMVNDHRPFREVAFELGKLLRIAADVADPSIMGAGDDRVAQLAREYQLFTELHLHEIPLVYDYTLPSPLEGSTVTDLLAQVTRTSRDSAARLAEAFWDKGQIVPATAFDYRSVPYAVSSLAYSRAVTAASMLWLASWSKANGDFTGFRFFRTRTAPGSERVPRER